MYKKRDIQDVHPRHKNVAKTVSSTSNVKYSQQTQEVSSTLSPDDNIIRLDDDRYAYRDTFLELITWVTLHIKHLLFLCRKLITSIVRLVRFGFSAHLKLALFMTFLILSPVLLITFAAINNDFQQQDFDVKVISPEAAQQPLYFPNNLPKGFSIQKDSSTMITGNDRLTTYTISNGRTSIAVNQQLNVPESEFSRIFQGSEKVITPLGSALMVVDDTTTNLAGIQLSNGVTLLLNSLDPVDKDVMTLILSSLDQTSN